MEEKYDESLGPIKILREAILSVPAVKYALGIAGIAAALAIIKTFITDLRVAVFGIIIMLLLMAVLFLFAKLVAIAGKDLRIALLVLLWSSLTLTIATAVFLFTSVFFNWPINLRHWVSNDITTTTQTSHVSGPAESASIHATDNSKSENSSATAGGIGYVRGKVVDYNGDPVADAEIEVEELPGQYYRTTTDGGFYIDSIPRKLGDRVRVYVTKRGYQKLDEYITLPGPVRIRLEK